MLESPQHLVGLGCLLCFDDSLEGALSNLVIPTHGKEMEQGGLAGPFKLRLFWDCVAGPLCRRDEKKTEEMALLC